MTKGKNCGNITYAKRKKRQIVYLRLENLIKVKNKNNLINHIKFWRNTQEAAAHPPSCHKGTRGLWLQTVHRTVCQRVVPLLLSRGANKVKNKNNLINYIKFWRNTQEAEGAPLLRE